MTPIWLDVDAALGVPDRDVDDGYALVAAYHARELQVVGVSTVFGNVPLDTGDPIARKLVADYGPSGALVHRGAASPSDLGVETDAVRALAEALRAGPLVVVALGPVTNVASLIQLHPELGDRVLGVVAVAGRRPGQRFTTGTANPRGHRDFNFEQDPEAFRVLLESGVALTLAPWELSSTVWIGPAELDRLAAGDARAQHLAGAGRGWLGLWQRTFAVDGFNPFDTLAIAAVADPGHVGCDRWSARIEEAPDDVTEAVMQGTNVVHKPYLIVDPASASTRTVTYCHTPPSGFAAVLVDRLTHDSHPPL